MTSFDGSASYSYLKNDTCQYIESQEFEKFASKFDDEYIHSKNWEVLE